MFNVPKNYKGGLNIARGRKMIECRNHHCYPYAKAVMEAHLKRELLPKEVVHHINCNPLDDRIENLQLVTQSEHMKIHWALKRRSLSTNALLKLWPNGLLRLTM